MPVTVEVTYRVKLDGSPAWKLAADALKEVDGQTFARLRPYEVSLVSFICHGLEGYKNDYKKKLSLANAAGFKQLMQLRNDAVAAMAAIETPEMDKAAKAAWDLFGSKEQSKKRPKLSAAKLQAARQSPEIMDFTVPGGGDARPDLTITCLKPVHPCDELCIAFLPDAIEQVVLYIRSQGLDLEDLAQRRQYGSTLERGRWRNGSAGIIMKLPGNSDDEQEAAGEDRPRKKYRACNKDQEAHADPDESLEALPLAGGGEADEPAAPIQMGGA